MHKDECSNTFNSKRDIKENYFWNEQFQSRAIVYSCTLAARKLRQEEPEFEDCLEKSVQKCLEFDATLPTKK